jgi:hypothetical protein
VILLRHIGLVVPTGIVVLPEDREVVLNVRLIPGYLFVGIHIKRKLLIKRTLRRLRRHRPHLTMHTVKRLTLRRQKIMRVLQIAGPLKS